jgi:DNA-binding response OmpR family regulator
MIELLWRDAPYVTERTIDVHITRLRKKLGSRASLIASRPGYGYRFNSSEE